MPVLSAGFMRAMHSWRQVPEEEIPRAGQEKLEAVVRRALELGINHFETARGYGTSERQLGKALRQLPRGTEYLIQTKVGPADDVGLFRSDVEDSLERLGHPRVDLLAIHGINDYRSLWQACRPGGCLRMARRLQEEGLAGYVGFSGHGPPDVLLQAVAHEADGGFDYLNLHWYYIRQENNPVLREAAARDMGVFIISPTDKGGMLQRPPDRLRSLCRPLSPLQFNDLYCLSRPEIHTISVGAAEPGNFDEHAAALRHLGGCGDLLAGIDSRLRQAMQAQTGFADPGEQGAELPPWQETPGYINLRYILWLWHLARGWGLVEYGKRQYRKLGYERKWLPGCNGAAAAQYDLAPAAGAAGMKPDELQELLRTAHALFAGENGNGKAG